MSNNILLVEDKRAMREMLFRALVEDGWNVTPAVNGDRAVELIRKNSFDVVLSDICLPGGLDGIDILREVKQHEYWTPVILMTAFGSIESAVEAMKLGAADFIRKPFQVDDLLHLIRCYAGKSDNRIIGSSPALKEAIHRAKKGAESNLSILILGESGTGKELLAKMIHDEYSNERSPFIPVNCAAIPRDLVESELFGAEKGAYTGSERLRKGSFEQAEGGTIFLDEIGDLPHDLQGKLLRVLQERTFNRVGSPKVLQMNARVISASNRDIPGETEAGTFRKDLYFRLSEFPIELPPLRHRVEDIPELVSHFLKQSGYSDTAVTNDALDALRSHTWPGNIRELRSIILRAAALTDTGEIDSVLLEITPTKTASGLLEESSKAASAREKELIIRALRETNGNRKKAAELLQVSYRTLLSRIKELQI